MKDRVNKILKSIYSVSSMALESEAKFFKNNKKYKYAFMRMQEEIKRRRFDNSFPIDPEEIRSVYVIKCNEFYKIGIAEDVHGRLLELNIGNPYILEIFLCRFFDNAQLIERELHKLFIDKHVRGEWFKLSDEDIEVLKSYFNP